MTLSLFNAIISVVVSIGLLFSALGWRHSLRASWDEPERFFALAKVLMATGIGFRVVFWDAVWGTLNAIDPEYASVWSSTFGRTNINIISNLIVGMGVYCSLKARQMILAQDRGINWHWTVAWAYPRAKTIMRIINERKQRYD